jgi:hypothetical protein
MVTLIVETTTNRWSAQYATAESARAQLIESYREDHQRLRGYRIYDTETSELLDEMRASDDLPITVIGLWL